MRLRNPDNRYKLLQTHVNNEQPPEGDLPLQFYNHVKGTEKSQEVAHALEIYSDLYQREVLQAWIVSGATDKQINAALRVPDPVLALYRYFFFDVTLLRDELDLLSWIREYETTKQGTTYGVNLLKQALMGGPECLAWIHGRGEVAVSPGTVMQQIMVDSYFRGKAHKSLSLDSKGIQTAQSFMNTAFKAAAALSRTQAEAINDDFIIKLRHRDLTESIEDASEAEEIIH